MVHDIIAENILVYNVMSRNITACNVASQNIRVYTWDGISLYLYIGTVPVLGYTSLLARIWASSGKNQGEPRTTNKKGNFVCPDPSHTTRLLRYLRRRQHAEYNLPGGRCGSNNMAAKA
jgi:hypothetical protein